MPSKSAKSFLHRKRQRTYFEDLPPELQRVLSVQLRRPGDVSAVIETPSGFQLYVCNAKTVESLGVAALVLSKRSQEAWLDELSGIR